MVETHDKDEETGLNNLCIIIIPCFRNSDKNGITLCFCVKCHLPHSRH